MAVDTPAATGFARRLSTFDATMLVAGSMIGSGIFIVSADIARTVGGAGWLLLVWLVTALMTVGGARCYAELATMFPHAGGQYVFLREAFGPLPGFLYGWTLFLVIQTGTIAAVAVAFAKFSGVIVPAVGSAPLVSAGPLAVGAQSLIAVVLIALLTVANCRGLTVGKQIQNLFTVAKLAALGGLVALTLLAGWEPAAVSTNLAGFWVTPHSGIALLAAIGAAMVGSLFSADAWNNVTFTAGEVRDPVRALPRALLGGTGIVVALYFLTNVGYLAVLPVGGDPLGADAEARGIAHALDDRVGTAVVQRILGEPGALLMAALILVSTLGCVNGLVLAGPRLYWAMAEDGLFFRGLARLNDRAVPARGLALQGVWAAVLALSGRYGQLLDYVIASALGFYALTVIGLLRLRSAAAPAGFPALSPRVRWLARAYVVVALAIVVDLLVVKPGYTWPGFAIVAAGLPAYALWRGRAARRAVPQSM